MKKTSSMDQDERIIIAVKKRPALYNCHHKFYKNNAHRIRLWREMSLDLGFTVEMCQKRWKRLRDRFCRIVRVKTPSGSAAYGSSKWPLLASLTFLLPFVADDESNLASSLVFTAHSEDSKTGYFSSFYPESTSSPPEGMSPVRHPSPAAQLSSEANPRLVRGSVGPASTSRRRERSCTPSSTETHPAKRWRTIASRSAGLQTTVAALNALKQVMDGLDHYGLSLANDLRQMDTAEQRRVKFEINRILQNATYKPDM